MVKRNAGFLPNMYFIQKIVELALKVTFWQRINLTNFTLRLEIQKIKNGCNQEWNKEATLPFGNREGHGSTG